MRAGTRTVVNAVILLGVALVVLGVFLPAVSFHGLDGPRRSFEYSTWDAPRLRWPLLGASAVALVATVAPTGWLRYLLVLLAGGAVGGLTYYVVAQYFDASFASLGAGSWVTMAGALLLVGGAFVGQKVAPVTFTPGPRVAS